jgi:hypothetical protein
MKKWYETLPPEVFGEETPKVQPANAPIGFTGYGQDGKLQPLMPTRLVQTMRGPLMLHEGETTIQNPNGSITVVPQKKLAEMEQQKRIPGMAEGGTYDPLAPTTPTTGIGTTPAVTPTPTPTQDVQAGIGIFRDVASGKSPMTESIYNRTMSKFGGAQEAAIGATKQEAAQAGYGKEAIGSVTQTAIRGMEGERSKLMGEIAGQTQQQMLGAAGSLVNAGAAERTYENTQKDAEWNRTLVYTDPSTPEGLKTLQDAYTRLYGTAAPDFNTLKEERDYARSTREQAVEVGKLGIDAKQIENDAARFKLTTNSMEAVAYMANNGFSLDAVNAALGTSLTAAEYTELQSSYKYAKDTQEIAKASAETQLLILKASVSKDMYTQMRDRVNDGIPIEELKKMDFNGDGTPDFPNLTQTAYDALGREKTIELATAQFNLDKARTALGTEKWNDITQKAKEGWTFDRLNTMYGLTGADALTADDVKYLREQISTQTPAEAFTEALLYNDISTDEGRAAIEQAWVDAHPGKTIDDVPDFNVLRDERNAAASERRIADLANSGKASAALISDLIENSPVNMSGWTAAQIETSDMVQQALKNTTLRQTIKTLLGPDASEIAIDREIKNRFTNAYKSDVNIIVEKFVGAGRVPTDYMDTPDYQGQLKRAIQDMLNEGVIDSEGNIVEGKAFDWPWNNPETMFNYTDWNGNDIVYDAKGEKPVDYAATQVSAAGNGTTFGKIVDGATVPVTFADMDARWGTLSQSQKEKYFTDGKFDNDKFVRDNFGIATGVNGGTVYTNINSITSYLADNEDMLNDIINNIAGNTETGSNLFASSATVPTGQANAGQSLSALNQFQYWGSDGLWHSASTTDPVLTNIWLQFSQFYNNGEALTSQEFQNYWKDGRGWIVDDDGLVVNFKATTDEEGAGIGTVDRANPIISTEGFNTLTRTLAAQNNYGLTNTAIEAIKGWMRPRLNETNAGWTLTSFNTNYGLDLTNSEFALFIQKLREEL